MAKPNTNNVENLPVNGNNNQIIATKREKYLHLKRLLPELTDKDIEGMEKYLKDAPTKRDEYLPLNRILPELTNKEIEQMEKYLQETGKESDPDN